MFTAGSSEAQRHTSITAVFVLIALLLALGLSLAAVYQVLEEYRMLGDWISKPDAVPVASVLALRQDIGGRIITRSIASTVILLCVISTVWLQQRQLTVRRTLDDVRWLALNVLASLDQGVITTDQQGNITSLNSAAAHLLGIDPECVGQSIGQITSAEVPLETMCAYVTRRKEAFSDRELTLERAGHVRRMVVSALELKNRLGATLGCVILLRDVTERMLMKEQMWRMEQFASLSTLAAGLHHEIKNPITALSIHVQLLEERLRKSAVDDAVGEMFDVLKSEVRRLSITLDSFRNFANLQRLNVKSVDPEAVLDELARLMGPQATQQGVRLALQCEGRPLPKVALDSEKIQQALLNLMLNALEAMPDGGELSLTARIEDERLKVVVRDTGPGIPPEIQDHIFHPYFSTKDNGTGIGLALAEKLVRQHHGQLDFRTGPAGTSFRITLPVKDSPGSANGA
ncbi:two-component system sensor histidine kinase NtrB [Singulisphaera sp. PoT]|uniref:two-component system sensor histidine kinase NtrB n=1 Tax=Singulisphaera sp. PoT TaxID=3411797 RepID=UPI003BF48029